MKAIVSAPIISIALLTVIALCWGWKGLVRSKPSFRSRFGAGGLPLAAIAILIGVSLVPFLEALSQPAVTIAKTVLVTDDARERSIKALRDALWKYAAEHKGKLPENCKANDFPAELWKSPDKLSSPYVYLAPSSWGYWRLTPPLEDTKFGYATRKNIRGPGTHQVLVGDSRRYVLVYEPPVFGDDRFVITSTGHVLRLSARELAVRIHFECEEINDASGSSREPPVRGYIASEQPHVPEGPIPAGLQLVTALRIWASDRQGSYPKDIEDLVRQGILEPDQFYRLNWREWNPGKIDSWILVKLYADSAPEDLPLLISPALEAGARVVAFNGAKVEKISAAQLRDWITKWKVTFKDMNEPWPGTLEGL